MSETLTISGGGAVTVQTAAMARIIDELGSLAVRLSAAEDRTALVESRLDWKDGEVRRLVGVSRRMIGDAAYTAASLGRAMRAAVDRYSMTEAALARSADGILSRLLGLVLRVPGAPLVAFPAAALGVLAAAVLAAAQRGGSVSVEALVNNAGSVSTVRALAGSADQALLAVMGVPVPIAHLLGDEGLGVVRDAHAAGLALAALGAGAATVRTAVTVSERRRSQAAAPGSLHELVSRVPRGRADGEQIVVERFVDAAGGYRSVVYLGGTTDEPGQPWDMDSNLALMAGQPSGSATAAAEAMRRAGIGSGEPVTFVGYSQGGAIASRLVESGEWNTAGLVTVGSPGASIPLPGHVPALALEHDEDLIPALAGRPDPASSTVTARRPVVESFTSADGVLAAHGIGHYIRTAELADADTEPRMAAVREDLLAPFMHAGTVERTAWRAERLSDAAPQGDGERAR